MTLRWRATFIDYIPPEEDRSRDRKRSVSAPAGAPKDFHFGGERSYISSLAERVGFVPEVSCGGEANTEVSAAMSLSVNALPVLDLIGGDEAGSLEEDVDGFGDDLGPVHSLSSLPLWRPYGAASPTMDSLAALEEEAEGTGGFLPKACGTAAPTMDSLPQWRPCGTASPTMESLCALEDPSEGTGGFQPQVQACGTAAPTMESLPRWWSCGTASPTMESLCALEDTSEGNGGFLAKTPSMESLCTLDDDAMGFSPQGYGTVAPTMDSLCSVGDGPTSPSGRAPTVDSLGALGGTARDSMACCHKDGPQRADGQDAELRARHNPPAAATPSAIPQPAALRSQGRGGDLYFAPPQRAAADVPYRAPGLAAAQGPARLQASFGFGEAGMRRPFSESPAAYTKERCPEPSARAAPIEEPRARPSGRGQDARMEAQRQEGLHAGGQRAAPKMPAATDAVSVAIDHGAAMIVIRQHISTPEDALALSQAVRACLQHISSISVVFIWAEGSQRCTRNFPALHEYTALRDGIAAVMEQMAMLTLPVLGFAASGSHCLPTTMLLAACDQVISLASGTFCVVQARGASVVSAKTALELGFLGRLVDDSASLLRACATYRHQLTACSLEELRRVKLSLQGTRSYLMDEALWTATRSSPTPVPASAAPDAGNMEGGSCGGSEEVPAPTAPDASNMEGGSCGDSDEVTSLMLCNLPCRLTQQQLEGVIESLGFSRKIVHLHFPASKGSANLGYVFVHLKSAEDAAAFTTAFRNYRFVNFQSKKLPEVRPARLQGKASAAGRRKRQARQP